MLAGSRGRDVDPPGEAQHVQFVIGDAQEVAARPVSIIAAGTPPEVSVRRSHPTQFSPAAPRHRRTRRLSTPVPPRWAEPRIDPGLLQLVAHLDDVATCIYTELGDVLHTNALDHALDWAHDEGPGRESNVYWLWFIDPRTRAHVPEADRASISAAHVSDLRATYSRRAA